MIWSMLKAAALDTLLKWVASKLWALAQEIVDLVSKRDDLSSEEKFKLAKQTIVERLQELGIEASTSGINWVLESAVQYFKYKKKT